MNNGEDWSQATYSEAEKAIGYPFRDRELLKTCFTHKTYANNCGGTSNERLEWLGDAVLELVVSDMLYRSATSETEGELTDHRKQYVCKEALTPIAEKLGLMRYLRRSSGKNTLDDGKTVSNLFEAVVGGIYLDGGFGAARRFLNDNLVCAEIIDYKSLLQEFVQKRVQDTPNYNMREENGLHICTVTALGKSASGSGPNDQAAQMAAAGALYTILTENGH